MLITLNIGNTNTSGAAWDGQRPAAAWRLRTDPGRTADEYAVVLGALLAHHGVDRRRVNAVALCSVVPSLTPVFAAVAGTCWGVEPLVVHPGLSLGIRLGYENPGELGADRIANAVAAYSRYGGPVIVVDLGTATTVDAVTADGVFEGGAIAPGVGISSEALFRRAARLSGVQLTMPERAIGRSTAAGLRSGIVFGFAGQVDALVARVSAELGGPALVVATGGLASLIQPASHTIREIEPLLTLEGIRLIHDRNPAGGLSA